MAAVWTSPELTSQGRLPMHSVPHLDRVELDGRWRFQLLPRPKAVIHLDAAHRGVGTAGCGPDTLPQYKVGPGTYAGSWELCRLA